MAPRKQTSGKTTGGAAKRSELPKFKKVIGLTKTVFPVKAKKLLLGAKLKPKPVSHNVDGGNLSDCSCCPHSVCERCIVILREFEERIKDLDVQFICPGCHEMCAKGDQGGGIKLYFGFENTNGDPALPVTATIHGCIEVTSRSQISSDPILVLHFVLETLKPFGSPVAIMHQALQLYRLQDHIEYHEIIFDIGTEEKANKHAESMAKLMDRLKHQYERVEILIYSHSDTM
ncbi:hypothetical protein EV702DRAFT_1204625 [Suillus placidus]|uniref:Uncharacterized protein n=1 Tax=Suillus placidus TaxID=48579 RepID=A0A9P6ZH36_9AGAM|nr:hypothetical protein EV702DRAFT_1204625 [Suillus placidus]